ncbi:uncharacterized protein LOC131334723 isoform X3 [Rhododendron vialii]|uniref:uncharacterized protein LOC131334723 isoform X3 n=1 Tax=Rhododendron vialii TaxID=182163 RepID=UPI00265F16F4|nr:uncharacterized protein LOC131334723 isoform X3 [Rhododendron vialii]
MTWTTSSHSLLLLPLASFVGPSISFVLSPLHCKSEEKKGNSKNLGIHKPLIFYCECFHVARVTGYQELIYQAIEAFEDLLFSEEESKKNEKELSRRGWCWHTGVCTFTSWGCDCSATAKRHGSISPYPFPILLDPYMQLYGVADEEMIKLRAERRGRVGGWSLELSKKRALEEAFITIY